MKNFPRPELTTEEEIGCLVNYMDAWHEFANNIDEIKQEVQNLKEKGTLKTEEDFFCAGVTCMLECMKKRCLFNQNVFNNIKENLTNE